MAEGLDKQPPTYEESQMMDWYNSEEENVDPPHIKKKVDTLIAKSMLSEADLKNFNFENKSSCSSKTFDDFLEEMSKKYESLVNLNNDYYRQVNFAMSDMFMQLDRIKYENLYASAKEDLEMEEIKDENKNENETVDDVEMSDVNAQRQND